MKNLSRTITTAGLALIVTVFFIAPHRLRAADHADSPSSANNASADLADLYFYLDPTDNSRAIFEITARGFIVPGEAGNMAIFDSDVTYQFGIEETGDAAPDAFVTINFTPRTGTATGQIANVKMTRGSSHDLLLLRSGHARPVWPRLRPLRW